jgi:hypothetical protein
MTQKRVNRIIAFILQNSKLNREKFVINKKKYTQQKSYFLLTSKKQYGTHTDPKKPSNRNYILLLLGLYGISLNHLMKN